MKNKNKRKGFSLMELIVVVAIIGALSGAAYLGVQSSKRSSMNNKMLDDLVSISNSLDQYRRDHGNMYPIPEAGTNMNVNCYFADATYAHDCEQASFIQGMIDNSLLGVKYLSEVPTDPQTGSRYIYGVSEDGQYFQVAGVWDNGGNYEARTAENVHKGFHLPSLIRSFDGPNFVVNKGKYLPYNPDHQVLIARLQNAKDTDIKKNGETTFDDANNNELVEEGDIIKTDVAGYTDIYFADGSVSHLDGDSELTLTEMSIPENNNKNLITKIKVFLTQGKIWNKVVRLAEKSEFNIETTQAIAGVRGTEFSIDNTGSIDVLSGLVQKIEGSTVNDIHPSDDPNLQMAFDIAFPKTLNNTIIPRILKADGNTVAFEKIDIPFTEIHSTLTDELLSFTEEAVTGNYLVTYTSSPDPLRFWFQDEHENRSKMSIQTTLNNLSEEISFEGAVDVSDEKPKAKWQISNPPSRIVAGGGGDNNFTFTATVLNNSELSEDLEDDEFLSYKLIIYSPSICMNQNTSTDYSMEGAFTIRAVDKGNCVYAVEAGAGDLYPDTFNLSFGISSPAKTVSVVEVGSFNVDYSVKTGDDCTSGTTLDSYDRDSQSGGSFSAFGDVTLLLCGEPDPSDGDITYQWNSSFGIIADETAKETFITILEDDIAGRTDGLVFEISMNAVRTDPTTRDNMSDTRTKTYHLVSPSVSSIGMTLNGESGIVTAKPEDTLSLSAFITDTALGNLTEEQRNITDNCPWEITGDSGNAGWHIAPYTDSVLIPEETSDGNYTITCPIDYLVDFSVPATITASVSFVVQTENSLLVACVGAVTNPARSGDETNGYTNSSKNTYYTSSGECWALASSSTESCLDVCGGKELSCSTDTDWTVTQEVCGGLQDGATLGAANHGSDYSPVLSSTECRNDNDNIRKCSESGFGPYRRICKCE